jgi:6-phosphogluconolactonase (cycloisomerase 2 family)
MKTYLIDLEEAVPYLARENPAQEHAPLAGHQKSRTPAAAPMQEQKRTWLQTIRKRSWVIKGSSALRAALAIAVSLFASPLRAQFVYVTNEGDSTVSGYTIDPSTGALTSIAGSPFAADAGPFSGPSAMAVDPSGKFAYVANTHLGTVSGYTIDSSTGALTSIAGSPFAGGIFELGLTSMTVDPSGKFAYVANIANGNNVLGYMINPSTGALTPITGSPFIVGSLTQFVAVDPIGRFAYFADEDGTVSGQTIDPSTGALTPIAGSPFSAGSQPISVAVDPSGKFAYVTNGGDDTVSGYTIDPTTGALTPIAGSPFAAGSFPTYLAITHTLSPLQQINQLSAKVQSLANAGFLNGGQEVALMGPLRRATEFLNRGQTHVAINQLQGFITNVNDFIRGGVLTQAQGQPLIAAANAVIHSLGG